MSSHFKNLAADRAGQQRPTTSHDRRISNNVRVAQEQNQQQRDQQRTAAEEQRRQHQRQAEDAHYNALSSYADDRGNNFLSNSNSVCGILGAIGGPTNAGRPFLHHLGADLSAELNQVNNANFASNYNHRNNNSNNNSSNNNNNRNNHHNKQQRGGGQRGLGRRGSHYYSGAKSINPLTLAKDQQEVKYGPKRNYMIDLRANGKQQQQQQPRQEQHQQQQQQQPKNSNFTTAATLQERRPSPTTTNNTMKNVNDPIPKKDKARQLKDPPPQQQGQIDLTESDDGPTDGSAAATATDSATRNKRKKIHTRSDHSAQEAKRLVEAMEQDDDPDEYRDYSSSNNSNQQQQRQHYNSSNKDVPIPTFGRVNITERTRKRPRQQQHQDVINVDDSNHQDDDDDDDNDATSPNNNSNNTSSSRSNNSSFSASGLLQGISTMANAVTTRLGITKVNNGSKKRKASGNAINTPGTSICNNNIERHDDDIAAAGTTYQRTTRNGGGLDDDWSGAITETVTDVPLVKPLRRGTFASNDNNNNNRSFRQIRAATAVKDAAAPSAAVSKQQQRQQPLRQKGKNGSNSSSSSPEIVEIDDDSDDDGNDNEQQQQVYPAKMRSKQAQSSENVYEAVRIATNGKVYTCDCVVALKDDGTLDMSCREAPEPTRTTRNTRSQNSGGAACLSSRINLNLDDAVQELKYFLVDDTIDVDDTDDVLEQEHLSFLFLKLNKACAGAGKPSSSKPAGTCTVLIEFRSDSDIKELLNVVGRVGAMAAFTNDGARLNVAQAKVYGKVLLEHSQREALQRYSTSGKKTTDNNSSKFLQGKDENDTLLVYPIGGGDAVEINAAANGLKELGALVAGGGDDAVVPRVSVAAAAAVATSSETSSSDDGATTDAFATAAVAPSASAAASKTGRTHNVTIQVGDYMRLDPEEYLNDSLIDFWMRWITRNGDNSTMHIFSTHFYTSLVDKGVDGVTNWTAKKNINIFEKKLLFIPINKSLHWSMVVVVNPLHIITMEHPEEANEDDPASFILFMDSLKAHQIAVIAKRIRTWLNSEWKRLCKNIQYQKDGPFNTKTLAVYNPRIPYQLNGWDCGVFMCRYAYALYLLRDKTFSFRETNLRSNKPKDRFRRLITESYAFDFTGDDIQRIRTEMKTLIERLSVIYSRVKEEEKQAKLAKKAAAKQELQAKQNAAAIANGDDTGAAAPTITTPVGNLQSSQDSSESTGVLEVGTVQKDALAAVGESHRRPQSSLQPDLDTIDEVGDAQLDSMMAAASLDDDRKRPASEIFNVKQQQQQHQRDRASRSTEGSRQFETQHPTSFATSTSVARTGDAMARGTIDGATAIANDVDSRPRQLKSNESPPKSPVVDENMEYDENVGEANMSHESLVSEVEEIPGRKRDRKEDNSCDI